MSDPHTLRHPRRSTTSSIGSPGCTARNPLRPSTGPGTRPRNPTHPLSPKPLTPHQHEVLQAVAEQRIHRDLLLGTLERTCWTERTPPGPCVPGSSGASSNPNPSDHHASPPADAGHSVPEPGKTTACRA